ncbi:U-box domain-containing protein 26 [Sesamum angolense]|uniref:U-box domain-containing protein n=1 Tax=Sesamum angolense TaxID=2727404 RepID=A0AAE1WXQ7_9LAMI|nr:U-box domain-containing protein 26 [Sesamum angolense]
MPGSLEPLDIGVQIPYHFRCPISLELMRDPVTVLYRSDDWCVANRSFGIERIPTPKQPADPMLVRTLLNQASSGSGPFSLRVSALRRLRGLSRDSDKNRSVIAANNAREVLLSIVFADVSSEPSELNLESLAILSVFTLSEPECLYVASDADRVRYLVNLLFHSSIDVRVNSAAMIEIVVAGIRSPELRAQISSADGVFEGIVGILNYPLLYPRALKIGIKALFALCLVKQHRQKAVAAGAVEALIDRLAEFEKCDAERALATVELLCRIPSGCAAFASHALTVPLLVKIILKISDRATEYAAGHCSHCARHRSELNRRRWGPAC